MSSRVPKKRRYDLREFWPWYERSWHTKGGRATPPPFSLEDLNDDHLMPPRQRKVAQVVCVLAALLITFFIVWGVFITR